MTHYDYRPRCANDKCRELLGDSPGYRGIGYLGICPSCWAMVKFGAMLTSSALAALGAVGAVIALIVRS